MFKELFEKATLKSEMKKYEKELNKLNISRDEWERKYHAELDRLAPRFKTKVFEAKTPDDVEYYGQLVNQAKKDKKSKKETQKILKDAGCPSDIMADLTQRM